MFNKNFNSITNSDPNRSRKHSANIKNVYSYMTSDYISSNYKNSNFLHNQPIENSGHSKIKSREVNSSKDLELRLKNFSPLQENEKENKSNSLFIKRKIKDLQEIRRKKLKELYDSEKINFKYEIISQKEIEVNTKKQNIEKQSVIQRLEENEIEEERYKPEIPSKNNSELTTNRNKSKISEFISNMNFHSNSNHNRRFDPSTKSQIKDNFSEKISSFKTSEHDQFYNSIIPTSNPKLNPYLDNEIKFHYKTLENLKLEDFFTRKTLQDHLLEKISKQMDKLKYGINDKSYQEKLAQDWLLEKQKNLNIQNDYNNIINRYNFNYNS